MLEKWTGEIVGTMHIYGINYEQLANQLNWSRKYLSMILNGHKKPKNSEEKVRMALEKVIEESGN